MSPESLCDLIALSPKQGVIHGENDGGAVAQIYFRAGAVVDAKVGRAWGLEALDRLFTWTNTHFSVEFKVVKRKNTIQLSTSALAEEATRVQAEWRRLTGALPPLDTVLEVNFEKTVGALPGEVFALLRLFDGYRTIQEILDETRIPQLQMLAVMVKLSALQLLRKKADNSVVESSAPPLEDWLTSRASSPVLAPKPVRRGKRVATLMVGLAALCALAIGTVARGRSHARAVEVLPPQAITAALAPEVVPAPPFNEASDKVDDEVNDEATRSALEFERLLTEGRTLFDKGDAVHAQARLEEAVRLDSKDDRGIVMLALCLLERGDALRAHALADEALKLNPKNAQAYLIIGAAQQGAGRSQAAKLAYQHYLQLAPNGQYARELHAIVESL